MSIRYFLFLVFFFVSCSSPSHWVSRAELEPSQDPNIEKIELVDGPIVEFTQALGWYNSENGTIEGVNRDGIRDTIPISRITRAEISGESNSTETGLLIISSFLVAAVVVLIFALIRVGNTSGL
jgi:hypothetical protein